MKRKRVFFRGSKCFSKISLEHTPDLQPTVYEGIFFIWGICGCLRYAPEVCWGSLKLKQKTLSKQMLLALFIIFCGEFGIFRILSHTHEFQLHKMFWERRCVKLKLYIYMHAFLQTQTMLYDVLKFIFAQVKKGYG